MNSPAVFNVIARSQRWPSAGETHLPQMWLSSFIQSRPHSRMGHRSYGPEPHRPQAFVRFRRRPSRGLQARAITGLQPHRPVCADKEARRAGAHAVSSPLRQALANPLDLATLTPTASAISASILPARPSQLISVEQDKGRAQPPARLCRARSASPTPRFVRLRVTVCVGRHRPSDSSLRPAQANTRLSPNRRLKSLGVVSHRLLHRSSEAFRF